MKIAFLFLCIVIFLTGCFQKEPEPDLDSLKKVAILNTKKCNFAKNEDVMILITYLNGVLQNSNKEDEKFIVSVFSGSKKGFNPFYSVSLNGDRDIKEFRKIDEKREKFLKYLPASRRWSELYMIVFKNIKERTLKLILENSSHQKCELKFDKEF